MIRLRVRLNIDLDDNLPTEALGELAPAIQAAIKNGLAGRVQVREASVTRLALTPPGQQVTESWKKKPRK